LLTHGISAHGCVNKAVANGLLPNLGELAIFAPYQRVSEAQHQLTAPFVHNTMTLLTFSSSSGDLGVNHDGPETDLELKVAFDRHPRLKYLRIDCEKLNVSFDGLAPDKLRTLEKLDLSVSSFTSASSLSIPFQMMANVTKLNLEGTLIYPDKDMVMALSLLKRLKVLKIGKKFFEG
jgi:hypothetical protein